MKITTFNPQIMTKDAEAVVKLFEELGFERKHTKEGIGALDVTGIRMKDANGNNLDISQADMLPDQDIVAIRMNVDDFDEAFNYFRNQGFKSVYGVRPVETESAKSSVLISPSGFAINLVQHIKE